MAGGYPASGGRAVALPVALPVANLSASDRWKSLGGSDGAPRQLEDGCRWVAGLKSLDGSDNISIDSNLIHQSTEGSEGGKITDLNFHFKFIQQVSGLDQFASNLRSLNLSSNNIRLIEGLGGMPKLRELKLYSCQISRIQNLNECVGLMSLHLEDNHIGVIEGLDSLRSLEYLNMDSNRVQKIGTGLARLTKLRELHMSRNQLSTLDGLANLTSLETCSFDNNRLTQITAEHVKGLGKLDELRVSGNQLQHLSFLAASAGKTSLPSLVQLDASCNRLTAASLRNLPPLPQLAELNLAGNQIEEIEASLAKFCTSLEILDLGGNLLHRGTEDLAQLKAISSLKELLIQGNPFISQSQPEVVQLALANLECLEFLDDKALEKADPQKALEEGGEDTETFVLTTDKSDPKRPGTASGSRPGTASSQRPGTAQKMTEAGVKDPLMHTKPKMSEKRYASEEQVVQWERQTLSGLAAVQKQINKTCHHIDADLSVMNSFLSKADKCLEREKVICANRPMSPDELGGCGNLPTLRSATVARANAELAQKRDAAPRRDSKIKFRLREAVQRSKEDGFEDEDDDDDPLDIDGSLPASPLASPSRPIAAAADAAAAACDEEVSEDEPILEDSPACSLPEPAPEEVEEELHDGEHPESSAILGPRAARARAAAAAVVAMPPRLHVDARAKDRGGIKVIGPVLDGNSRPGSGNQGLSSSRVLPTPTRAPKKLVQRIQILSEAAS